MCIEPDVVGIVAEINCAGGRQLRPTEQTHRSIAGTAGHVTGRKVDHIHSAVAKFDNEEALVRKINRQMSLRSVMPFNGIVRSSVSGTGGSVARPVPVMKSAIRRAASHQPLPHCLESLRCTCLIMIRTEATALSLRLSHILAGFRLPIPTVARAMIDL